MNINSSSDKHSAWNPGLDSQLPREYLPLATIFRDENVTTSAAKAYELSDFCGLPAEELVAFRVERLVIHELLVHVTTGIAVPDGRDDEDLGKNFRGIAATILNRFISPHREHLARVFEGLKNKSSAIVERELSQALARTKTAAKLPVDQRWPFSSAKLRKPSQPPESAAERDLRLASEWLKKAQTSDDRLEAACFAALHKVATAVIGRHGRLLGDEALLEGLAVTLVCNDFGSEVIGEAILPFVQEAVVSEGFRFLPRQDKPVVMNVKGASASGKSSMRPLQKHLAGKLNLPWQEFALISPDIWRKFLLDYATLGAAYKYAGTLTGHEIEIIDKKLDHRMAARAARGEMPHLLIDRFRFDSFSSDPGQEDGSRLLTRFGFERRGLGRRRTATRQHAARPGHDRAVAAVEVDDHVRERGCVLRQHDDACVAAAIGSVVLHLLLAVRADRDDGGRAKLDHAVPEHRIAHAGGDAAEHGAGEVRQFGSHRCAEIAAARRVLRTWRRGRKHVPPS